MSDTVKIDDWPEIMTPKEAARFARLHPDTVYTAVKNGSLRSGRTGRFGSGHIRITKTALLEWLNGVKPGVQK